MFRAVVAEYLEHETKGEKTFLGEECEGFDMGELMKVLDKQAHVLSETPGLYTGREVKLTVTEGVKPVNQPVRRVPFSLKEGVKEAVSELVEQGIVERADDSLWCSLIVRKPDGSVRVCVDFRALNEATPQIRHHMLDEVLDQAGEFKVLTTLDSTAGFHQLALTEDCRDLTTFSCQEGKFGYKRLPFGLKNAPAIFQQVVDQVLRDVTFASCYVDDILIYSRS